MRYETIQPRFSVGQTVLSKVDAQGLTRGTLYNIASVRVRSTPFGGFTTYIVTPVGAGRAYQEIAVGNGHLVLTEVA